MINETILDGQPEPQAAEPPVISVADAQRGLVESQIRLRVATDRQRDARGRVARCIARWQEATGARLTPEMNVRQHLASAAQERADRAAGLIPPRGAGRVLPSRVDQIAAATAGANYGRGAGAFAYKRGAVPLAASQRALNEMARVAKLPSER